MKTRLKHAWYLLWADAYIVSTAKIKEGEIHIRNSVNGTARLLHECTEGVIQIFEGLELEDEKSEKEL